MSTSWEPYPSIYPSKLVIKVQRCAVITPLPVEAARFLKLVCSVSSDRCEPALKFRDLSGQHWPGLLQLLSQVLSRFRAQLVGT